MKKLNLLLQRHEMLSKEQMRAINGGSGGSGNCALTCHEWEGTGNSIFIPVDCAGANEDQILALCLSIDPDAQGGECTCV